MFRFLHKKQSPASFTNVILNPIMEVDPKPYHSFEPTKGNYWVSIEDCKQCKWGLKAVLFKCRMVDKFKKI